MSSQPKLMVVASAGGHWVQLMRLRMAWRGLPVIYLSTEPGLADIVATVTREDGSPPATFASVTDANLSEKGRLLRQLFEVLLVVLRYRPDVIITTGAAPGYFALRFGKLFGARTIWIDSMANAETLSKSGREVGKYADLWLTQWEHLARPEGPHYMGSVL
ncbi:UDP-N-acetylglucosamine--LPS N-acetylglucosamine transferase [Roseovarius autotrophicus]|uniref:UDP-N-acetylglucosamine--LPS N-acetylglucosamine transferase n=1 Tax=Roseovarius autotrophicus TaxID=2824121 RepID=UPI001A00CC37|nr:UDP-N-acetylglucosamine--LPS N-acetylglucosamine transferase [Roseovarius autotrophicus]MBE0454284.1 UDP-N-acetylglucosamine--LPS N-acetylglucosamine transferase [Roseovarius sp.]